MDVKKTNIKDDLTNVRQKINKNKNKRMLFNYSIFFSTINLKFSNFQYTDFNIGNIYEISQNPFAMFGNINENYFLNLF